MSYAQIWLTGFMGSGKSRVARPLAAALDWTPLDIDKMVEDESGDTVAGIFQSGGEAAFRVLESEAVERVAGMSNVVVATGGGTVLSETNRAAMKRRGFVVLLEASVDTLAARIRASDAHISERPLLAGGDALYRIGELKQSRQEIYSAVADLVVQTDELTADQVTHAVLVAFREHSPVAEGTA